MRFLSDSQCSDWIATLSPAKTTHKLSLHLPNESARLLFIARTVAHDVMFREECLLRVTESRIWPSSNNWHLYYRIRQSYGDRLLMDEAPGHLFLDYEAEDLATFLHIAMLFGWDAELRPRANYIHGFSSHDGFLELYSGEANQLMDLHKVMIDATVSATMKP